MATRTISILGWKPDASGDVYFEPAEVAMTIGNVALDQLEVCTIQAPTGSDIGVHGTFQVPPEYVDTPKIVIRMAIAEAASILAFGCQFIAIADSEAFDVAFDTEDLVNKSSWTTYAAEDILELVIDLTPAAAFVAGDIVNFFGYRDDSVDTQTGEIHIVPGGVLFRFNDA